MIKAFSAAALFFALTSVGLASDALSVANPYVRAMPPVIKNTTAYMQLKNSGDLQRTLVSAESSVARLVELHTHIREDGMLKMRRVEKIDIPAHQTVELKPGDMHVMLIGLTKNLNKLDSIELTLVFENGERMKIDTPVKSARTLH